MKKYTASVEFSGFIKKFRFRKAMAGYVGVERERFLVLPSGILVPRSGEFLRLINDSRWTYELSACQVEDRTRPCKDASQVKLELLENDNNGRTVAEKLQLRLLTKEVQDAEMPLDVYPDPRYLAIVRSIPKERLSAACRVTGTHLHFGMKDINDALRAYNALLPHVDELCLMGDHSQGERIRLYKEMAVNWEPPAYENSEHFFETALKDGFVENPRNCWHLIRISVHGTVELRMFGVTRYADEIVEWISYVRSILKGV